MANNLNKKLERLNARIDVWIDDEDYSKVDKALKITTDRIDISDNGKNKKESLESLVKSLFEGVENTHDLDGKWGTALGYNEDILPVTQAEDKGSVIKKFNANELDKYWSHLFYTKLLRAKIKQKGSDCYTRRLDDVATYLERHLPQQNGDDEWKTRLTLMYLLELSAVSQDWESLGFAERARRVIRDRKYFLTLKYKKCKEDKEKKKAKEAREKAPYKFYELWAHYNIGVAYFHQAYYREAVQEFNRIIWQTERWQEKEKSEPESKENLNAFKDHYGLELLYLPAILSRAEVQLKLQFAYHSLDTLDKRFWENKFVDSTEEGKTPQKEIRAMIIKTEAYQQLGRLDKSWACLDKVYKKLPKNEGAEYLGHRLEAKPPTTSRERFIDLLIADHLGWLKREGEEEQINQEDDLELRYIVKNGKTKKGEIAIAKNYEEAIGKASPYLDKLIKIFSTYHDVVKHHAYNRSGYFQQLAKYLGWLAEAADYKYSDPAFARGRDGRLVNGARKKIAKIAKNLYDVNKDGLLEEEPGPDDEGEKKEEAADSHGKEEGECLYCDPKGIDLRRLGTEHYTWFTEDMLKFFKSKTVKGVLDKEAIKKDKGDFVKRLIKREQIDKEDLRIHDLKLRYEYYGKEELLRELLKGDKNEEERQSSPHKKCAEWLCWREQENQAESLGLPICGNNENKEDSHLTSDGYLKIMQEWNEGYLRQLQSPSTHENHRKGGFYFMGLQRWNSASPAKGYSVGGGYLLYHLNEKNKKVDMGIAIDPGFDFVRNLFHMGFSLDDIDIVLISHAHLDHIRDFESIVMLLSELEKRGKREKRVHVILSLGAYRRLKHVVEDPRFRYFLEPYIIDVDREISDDYFENEMPEFRFKPATDNKKHENSKGTANDGKKWDSNPIERFRAVLSKKAPDSCLWAKITPTRAYHDDKTSYSDSFGFLIELNEKVKKPDGKDEQKYLTFGYTGDTKWVYPNMSDPLKREDKHEGRKIEDIAEQYKECDVLLVHLGSLIGKDDNGELSFTQYDQCGKNANKYRCEELVRENDHPYLIGMLRLLSSYYNCVSKAKHTGKPLVLVSEFGEELRGTIRSDFIQRLREVYGREMAFLPVDVGLNVQMGKKDNARGDSHDNRCACKVWCVQCNQFVNIDDAAFELYGTDHALYCVCKTCRKATPVNVLQDRLRQLYEVGLELRTNDNK